MIKLSQSAELISDSEVAIETMDAECRCMDYTGDDIDEYMDNEVIAIFAYGDKVYLRIEV